MRIVLSIVTFLATSSLCHAQNSATKTIDPLIATQVANGQQTIKSLSHLGKPIELIFTGHRCVEPWPTFSIPFPTKERAMPGNDDSLDRVRHLVSGDPTLVVSMKADGIIVISTGGANPELLKTRISRLKFSDVERYNPHYTFSTLLSAPEVESAEQKLRLSLPNTICCGLGELPSKGRPHLDRIYTNITVQEILSEELLTFNGVAVYEECKRPDGSSIYDMNFFRYSSY